MSIALHRSVIAAGIFFLAFFLWWQLRDNTSAVDRESPKVSTSAGSLDNEKFKMPSPDDGSLVDKQGKAIESRRILQANTRRVIANIWTRTSPAIRNWESAHAEILEDMAADWQKGAPPGVQYTMIYVPPVPAEFRRIVLEEITAAEARATDKKMFQLLIDQELNSDYMYSDQGTLVAVETHENPEKDGITVFRVPSRDLIALDPQTGRYGVTSVGGKSELVAKHTKLVERFSHLFRLESDGVDESAQDDDTTEKW